MPYQSLRIINTMMGMESPRRLFLVLLRISWVYHFWIGSTFLLLGCTNTHNQALAFVVVHSPSSRPPQPQLQQQQQHGQQLHVDGSPSALFGTFQPQEQHRSTTNTCIRAATSSTRLYAKRKRRRVKRKEIDTEEETTTTGSDTTTTSPEAVDDDDEDEEEEMEEPNATVESKKDDENLADIPVESNKASSNVEAPQTKETAVTEMEEADDDDNDEEEEEEEEEDVGPVFTRGDEPVVLYAPDIRALVGGGSSFSTSSSPPSSSSSPVTSVSFSSMKSPTSGEERVQGTTFATNKINNDNDALKQLLADAQSMQDSQLGGSTDRNVDDDDDESRRIASIVKNIISTVVTVDFFVVCGFLLWFLAGIFSSYVLENDAIQIAFNGIFQPLVQPSLGILMIGALAGAIFKEEEDDNDNNNGNGAGNTQ